MQSFKYIPAQNKFTKENIFNDVNYSLFGQSYRSDFIKRMLYPSLEILSPS